MKHIRIIFPGSKTNYHTLDDLKNLNLKNIKIDIVNAEVGPETIANRCEEALAIPGTLQQIVRAEKEGVDAVVIDCMGDPGVEQGRELVNIPIIGPSRTSMHIASTLGERFAVITMAEAVNPLVKQQARIFNLESRLAAALSIEIHPALLQTDLQQTTDAICKKALEAIEIYGADTLIFGCCGMMGCALSLKNFLLEKGYPVPVIDPLPLAIHYTKMLIDLQLTHSKQLYGYQKLNKYPGFDLLK